MTKIYKTINDVFFFYAADNEQSTKTHKIKRLNPMCKQILHQFPGFPIIRMPNNINPQQSIQTNWLNLNHPHAWFLII